MFNKNIFIYWLSIKKYYISQIRKKSVKDKFFGISHLVLNCIKTLSMRF